MAQTKTFFMLMKSYNLSQLSAKILEGKTSDAQRNWQLNWAAKQLNQKSRKHKLNYHFRYNNISLYLTAYSTYTIKSCSSFLMATNEVLRGVLFSFHSVSKPVLSESLATLLHVVVNFQPEVSCRVHAIVSKLCHFFSC